jgi:integrase/recombinase XerD
MTVNDAGKAFLAHCSMERQLSANTLAAYRQDVAEFGRRFAQASVTDVSGKDMVDYAAYLAGGRSLAPATVKRRLACLRTMFGWLTRRRTLAVNPFTDVEIRVRIPDRLPRCLSRAEMSRLAGAAEKAGPLTQLATLLLFCTGARVSELAAVTLGDVDPEQGTIRIFGKGDRERQVYVTNPGVRALLSGHMLAGGRERDPAESLLAGRTGYQATAASIRRLVKALSLRAGMARPVTPHVLRHTAATALLEAGVDMRFVQRLLGHRSILTTQIYTHVSDRALRAAVTGADVCALL